MHIFTFLFSPVSVARADVLRRPRATYIVRECVCVCVCFALCYVDSLTNRSIFIYTEWPAVIGNNDDDDDDKRLRWSRG